MILWILAAVLTAAVTAALLTPLMRARPSDLSPAGARERLLAVYRDQLSALDQDLARGLVDPTEGEALKAEIGRRLLSAAAEPVAPAAAAPRSRRLAGVLALALPLLSLGLYLVLGSPGVPDMPYAQRFEAGVPPKVLTALHHLVQGLKAHPDDLQGWLLLGRSYGLMGRIAGSVDAYGHAVALAPHDGAVQSAYGEALTQAAGGSVTGDARAAFQAALAADPAEPRSRYYLALARAQDGDLVGAIADWQALAKTAPPNAPWLPAVEGQIAEAQQQVAAGAGHPPAAGTGAGMAAPPAGAAAAIASLPPEQRAAAIRGMVDRLAAQLKANPDNPDGWRRLARAYQVLGEPDKAADALKHAATAP